MTPPAGSAKTRLPAASARSEAGHERVLDPVERLSEVLFGLIMVLGFVGSISVSSEGEGEVRSVLVAAIGCNLAWGIVDAVMYLLTLKLERGRMRAIGRAVRASEDPAEGRRLLLEALPEPFDQLLEGQALEEVRRKLSALPLPKERPGLVGRDWIGALGVFLLVFLSTFPVVLPFLFLTPLHTAMRVSNAVAVLMLFVAGWSLGGHAELGRMRMGLSMVGLGIVLVGVTMALGG